MKKILLSSALALLGLGFGVTQAQTISSQDFEGTSGTSLPAGWSQVSSVPGAWVSGTSATFASSSFTVPDHTRFVGVNDDADSSTHNTSDTLFSPSFSLTGITGAYLNFDIAYLNGSYGGDQESFKIIASTDNGATWTLVSSDPGNTVYYWETRHLNLSSYDGDASVMLAYVYSDGGGWEFGVALDNIVVNVPPAVDIALSALTPAAGSTGSYGLAGSTVALGGTVTNNSPNAVSSFQFNYAVGSGAVQSSTITASIPAFGTYNLSANASYPSAAGTQPLVAWVSESGDAIATNDSATTSLTAVSHMPVKRVMFEEATGTWCGWCVRGLVYMDSLYKTYANGVSIVSVHDQDTMSVETNNSMDYDQFISSKIQGYPSIVVDRAYVNDPSTAFQYYDALTNAFGFADLSMTGSTTGGNINATVNVTPAINLNGDYRLAMVVTEDSVHGTDAIWDQHNYYSSQVAAQYGNGPGDLVYEGTDFYNLPFEIPNLYFPFVNRITVPDMGDSPNGVANSLPPAMTAGSTYSYTFSAIPITSYWVPKNLRMVVMLIDNNPNNATYGQVLNSVNTAWPLGVANVSAGIEGVRLFPNPANQEAYLGFSLKQSSNVQVQVYDELGRMVYNSPAQNMGSGNQQITINTSNFAAGVYNVKLQTENGTVTQRLAVVR